jgi:hypothetical protein
MQKSGLSECNWFRTFCWKCLVVTAAGTLFAPGRHFLTSLSTVRLDYLQTVGFCCSEPTPSYSTKPLLRLMC